MAPHGWQNSEVKKLLKLHAKGLSCSAMAAAMGERYTKNSVIGKLHRLGLTGINNVKRRGNLSKRLRPKQQPKEHTTPKFSCHALPVEQSDDKAIVSHNDLEPDQCRYIPASIDPKQTGQTEPMYCGQEKLPGLPYCAAHAQRCYHALTMLRHRHAPVQKVFAVVK